MVQNEQRYEIPKPKKLILTFIVYAVKIIKHTHTHTHIPDHHPLMCFD